MCVKGLSCIGDAIDIVRMWAEVRVGLVTPSPENTINTMRMKVEVRVGGRGLCCPKNTTNTMRMTVEVHVLPCPENTMNTMRMTVEGCVGQGTSLSREHNEHYENDG